MQAEHAPDVSEDAVLGGRLRLRQPLRGHRVGHDAILLAAAAGARAGNRAADLGAGVGAAGLVLAARISGLDMTLIEIDAGLSALAAQNAILNKLDNRVRTLTADVCDDAALAAAGLRAGSLDCVLMNPPFNDPARQNVSPDPLRRLAHVAAHDTLERWIAAAATLLNASGTLTMIWRAAGRDAALEALGTKFSSIAILPVLPRPGEAAIRVLLRARKGERAALRTYPDLVLNDAGGRPSLEAEAILRGGRTLPLADQ